MKLLLCGDFVPTAASVPSFEAKDTKALMGTVLDVTARVDFAVANLECALTNGENRIRKMGPNLNGKPEYAQVIAAAGFTHLGLANNHTQDFGLQGMRDTAAAVQAAGMTPFGFGENDQDSRKALFLEKDGVKAAIIAVCEHEYSYALADQFGANPFDPFDTMEDIEEAKKQADYVIVMYHGGKEQCEYPSPRLRKACHAMVRAGADLVLCQHSHCIGCRENYRGGEIVYGEGNFNFVKYVDSPQWKCGLIAEVCLENGLQVAVVPRKGFTKKLAYFVTDYGSIHTDFVLEGRQYQAPAGVAHYLEHKMFDMPGNRDVSAEFAAMGAMTNAFTSYDMTAYYFSTTENFDGCLRLLLEFVSTPHFTEESVEKERGIIDQEIGMNLDSPDSRVFDSLMEAMFRTHPIRVPILGTSETIREITPEVLDRCHRAFYTPDNMLLCVVGDVEPENVAAIAREVLGMEHREAGMKIRNWEEAMTCASTPMSRPATIRPVMPAGTRQP